MGGRADERVAQRPQEACLVHGASGEGDRLLGGVLGRGHHRKAAHPRRLETLPLGGTTIPPTMTPIDGSSNFRELRHGEVRRIRCRRRSQYPPSAQLAHRPSSDSLPLHGYVSYKAQTAQASAFALSSLRAALSG